MNKEYELPVIHFFCGSGGGAYGMQNSTTEYKGVKGRFTTLLGIDCDPYCCKDFEKLTGVPAAQMDLFDRKQYIDFWGHEPTADWHEITPEDIRAACKGIAPYGAFMSAPCKGFSGLLPEKSAKTPKYQALNRLTIRSIKLLCEAFMDDLPAFILFENVPRIKTRGRKLVDEIESILKAYGYEINEADHDCGEIGQLGQYRKRFLLIARNPQKIPAFIYQPKKYKHKTIGDIIGPIPMPGDTEACGPMHRMPNLAYKTWVKLAMIPAGKDIRALGEKAMSQTCKVQEFDSTAITVTGRSGFNMKGQGCQAVADSRAGQLSVSDYEDPSRTVTGAKDINAHNGGIVLADKRFHANRIQVQPFDKTANTVTGGTGVFQGAGIICDVRYGKAGKFGNNYQVNEYDQPANTVIGARIGSGALLVADKRNTYNAGKCLVMDYNKPSNTITANGDIHTQGAAAIADPRISEDQKGTWNRSQVTFIQEWDKPNGTVTGKGNIHGAGSTLVADPRTPEENENGIWIIIAEDGTWHRPLTTFELAMLQGFPSTYADGSPLCLSGKSDARWREHIGNAVPPPAALAMGTVLLETIIPCLVDGWHWGTSDQIIWVDNQKENKGGHIYA